MVDLPENMRRALDADDAEDLGRLVQQRQPEDRAVLLALIEPDSGISDHYRTKALYALSQWGDLSVVPTIVAYLSRYDERTRVSAIAALGHLPTSEAITAVVAYADDPSPQVRSMVISTLRDAKTPEARQTLSDIASDDPVPWVREKAAEEIG